MNTMNCWEANAQRQREEIKTIAPRTLTLNLSDADVERIAMTAARGGLTVAQLLENFIGDLVDGTYSNGSDERDYAWRWYERCGFECFTTDSNIAPLARWYVLDSMVDHCEAYMTAIADLEIVKEDCKECEDVTEEDVKAIEEWVEDCRKEIESLMIYAQCTGTLEDVVSDVIKWKTEKDKFKNHPPA